MAEQAGDGFVEYLKKTAKPIVTFQSVYPLVPELNGVAFVGGLKGHPLVEGDYCRTSRIVSVKTSNGQLTEFETLNTIYRPEEK